MIFDGTFKPPNVGTFRRPIPIAGPGRVEMSGDGLEILGLRRAGRFRVVRLALVIVFAMVASAVIAVMLQLPPGAVTAVLVASVMGPALRGRSKAGHQPIRYAIAWAEVRKAKRCSRVPEMVMLGTRKPRGTFYFEPKGGPAAFLDALERHGVAKDSMPDAYSRAA